MQRGSDFNQFVRLKNQLVFAARSFVREENLTPSQIATLSKDLEQPFRLVHKLVDVVDRPYRKICLILLPHNLDKPESFDAQIRTFARKKAENKLQKFLNVKYKPGQFIQLHDVMNPVYDKALTNHPILIVLQKELLLCNLNHFFESG